jgi:hypothetical protein
MYKNIIKLSNIYGYYKYTYIGILLKNNNKKIIKAL